MPRYHIGVDIGGTFTDVVSIDEDGHVRRAKAPTTPDDYPRGIFDALETLAREADLDLGGILRGCELFINGTTIVTNAIAELRGRRVGLITTRGFRDTLRIARSARTNDMDLWTQTPPPDIVAREDIAELDERVDSFGQVVVPLHEEQVREAIRRLVEGGCEALAVCFLWSFANSAHEQRVREIAGELYPDLFVSISSRVFPVAREYERMVTTVFNSYASKGIETYVDKLERELKQRGLGVELSMMQSIGGLLSTAEAQEQPIQLINSGPVGGALGARALTQALGIQDAITADMGGTSFDTALIKDGELTLAHRVQLGKFDTGISMVDISAIGAGGGSVCWLDSRGAPRVGPQSAGAVPGPACYGRGGAEPTVTDVAVALGLIDPDYFLGGAIKLDRAAAASAVRTRIAEPLGWTEDAAASGLYQIVTDTMANAVRSATIEKGYDPRRFVMVSFGGASGLFMAQICRTMGIKEIIIPDDAAVFSAYGLLWADGVRSFVQTVNWIVPAAPLEPVNAVIGSLAEQARSVLAQRNFAPDQIELRYEGDLKFAGQIFELTVPLPAAQLTEAHREQIASEFKDSYERLYGKGTAWEGFPPIMLNARVTGIGRVNKPALRRFARDGGSADRAWHGSREALLPDLGRRERVAVYRGAAFAPVMSLQGPAIVEDVDTTIYVPTGAELSVDEFRNYRLTV